MDKPSQLTKLLDQSASAAGNILRRGQYLQRLNQLLSRVLDTESRLHCRIGNVRDGLLILYTDSTAWATRLRYQAPALLAQLQQQKGLEGLQKIELRVLPEGKQEVKHQKASLSNEAASCITACADGIEDERLRNALKHLAKHHKIEE